MRGRERVGGRAESWRLAPMLLALLLVLAACGDGGSEDPGEADADAADTEDAATDAEDDGDEAPDDGDESADDGADADADETCEDPDEVRYLMAASSATLGSVGYLQVPEHLGYFEDECLDVTSSFTSQGSSAGAVAALETGQADVSVLGTLALVSAMAEGVEQKAGYFTAFRNLGLFSLADGDVQEFSDLAGLTVGTNDLGTSATIYCEAAAAEAGLGPDDYELLPVAVDLAAAAESLRTGRLDAWCGIDSAGSAFQNAGLDVHRLDSPIDDTLLPPGALVFSNSFLEDHPDVAERMMRAIMRGMTFALEAPEKATQIAYHEYPESVPEADSEEDALEQGLNIVNQRMVNSTPPGYPEQPIGFMTEEQLEAGLAPWIDAGSYPADLPVSAWADMSLLQRAAETFDREAAEQEARDFVPPDFSL